MLARISWQLGRIRLEIVWDRFWVQISMVSSEIVWKGIVPSDTVSSRIQAVFFGVFLFNEVRICVNVRSSIWIFSLTACDG